jgi:hypothetical protein
MSFPGALPAEVGVGGPVPDPDPLGGVLYLLIGRVWRHAPRHAHIMTP